ncbi:hypothetical protein ACSBR2_035042 [Camellia fascicularis]
MESGLDPQMSNTSHGSEDESLMEMGSGSFGCSHYRRRCKIRAPCCDEIFDCRHCHNESKNSLEVNPLNRHDIPQHELKRDILRDSIGLKDASVSGVSPMNEDPRPALPVDPTEGFQDPGPEETEMTKECLLCYQAFKLAYGIDLVLGALWYLFSIERETTCWKQACEKAGTCANFSVYCGQNAGFELLNTSCPIQTPNTTLFDFGIFLSALQSGIVGSTDFPQKFFYCFWWGLQNLSSLGQNLKTSTFVWEICFAVFISISGLVLFSFLIGNMQTYLQSTTKRLEEMRVKR